MAVVIDCPSCQRKLRLPAKKLGQPLKCPACSHLFTPPAGPPAASPPVTPEEVFAALTNPPPSPREIAPEPTPEATSTPPASPPPTPPEAVPPDANGAAPTTSPPPPVETTLQPVYVESSWLMDTLFFRKMITPLFIQFFFWGGAILSIVGGASGIVLGLFGYGQTELKPVMIGLFLILLGPVLIRVVCELLLVVFYIYDTLMEIKRNTSPVEKPPENAAKVSE